MKTLVGTFNQEKVLVGAFSVIVKTDWETDGSFHSTSEDRTITRWWRWCDAGGEMPQSAATSRPASTSHVTLDSMWHVTRDLAMTSWAPWRDIRRHDCAGFWRCKCKKEVILWNWLQFVFETKMVVIKVDTWITCVISLLSSNERYLAHDIHGTLLSPHTWKALKLKKTSYVMHRALSRITINCVHLHRQTTDGGGAASARIDNVRKRGH